MPKRNWDNGAIGVFENSRRKIHATVKRNVRSACQACALQIPTFFCDWDCDGSGSRSQREDVSRISNDKVLLPPTAQEVDPESHRQEYAELFASPASTITNTSTNTSTNLGSCLASPSPNDFNWPIDFYDVNSLALASHTPTTRLEQPDHGESPTTSCLDFPWRKSQFRYPATEIKNHCGEYWLERHIEYDAEALDLHDNFDEPKTSKGHEQDILQADSILQRLAKMDRRLQGYAKQQLRLAEYYMVENHCHGLTESETPF